MTQFWHNRSRSRSGYWIFWWYVIWITGMTACSGREKSIHGLVIQQKVVLDSVPSGSGIVNIHDSLYVVGDDAAAIYVLTGRELVTSKLPITGIMPGIYREAKAVKHDFEAATVMSIDGVSYLLAFGSGTNTGSRDSLLVFNPANSQDQRVISLDRFYAGLQERTGITASQWNIEGATVAGDRLLLCDRGTNTIMSIDAAGFVRYLFKGEPQFPGLSFHQLPLPSIDGHEARLSGLCAWNDSLVLFCASVEDTPDWTRDGPVLGSCIGIYSPLAKQVRQTEILKDSSGAVLIEKLESVDIAARNGRGPRTIVAIGDNDDGRTNVYWLQLQDGTINKK